VRVAVIHGPNLNLLGSRELSVYGDLTLEAVNEQIRSASQDLGMEVEITQTAREGEIIELLHAGIDSVNGALLNPGAYAHTSRAIADAVTAVDYPVVEVHLSNIHAREPWRRRSVTAEAAYGMVTGFGAMSYVAGLHVLKGLGAQR
jgi:3-dehydroquinate dehydratase-2